MTSRVCTTAVFVTLASLIAVQRGPLQAQRPAALEFTETQASQGKALYDQQCASCHGEHLDDGQFAPPLRGLDFRNRWGGRQAGDLFTYMESKMPPGRPGALGADGYLSVLAFLLQQNGVSSSALALTSDPTVLVRPLIPGVAGGQSGDLALDVKLPPAPARRNMFAAMAPVTDASLANPDAKDWLTWRRTQDGLGFSPLKQIDKRTVKDLRVAWGWSLPSGPNTATPLVHDGVMFLYAYGDIVQALDAATGDLLWEYARPLSRDASPSAKRNLGIYGDRVFMAASDGYIVALGMRTGRVEWEHRFADRKAGYGVTGGPLVAQGVVMIGTTGRAPGGNYIVGLDAATGRELWRFQTIARDEAGGNSWNGLPLERRNGASVWLPGTYDPVTKWAFFGPAQTYDTGPLRVLTESPGVTNDALFTNSTIALEPKTGRLVWHFQHLPNDQWDLDWAFERQIVDLPVNGVPRRVVVTGGKQAIFDMLDAQTGKYLKSVDLGLQNVVTAIDPVTGRKKVDQSLVPGDGKTKLVCPHVRGGRDWLPTSFDPSTKLLFVPVVEACMDLVPVAAGEYGIVTGVRARLRPRPDGDGMYGRIQAVNLETKSVAWIARQRAPQTTGILTTAGGVLFAGSLDRVLSALDSRTGERLWQTRLNDTLNAAPITYMAGDRQYIAVSVGGGNPTAVSPFQLTPEIRNPSSSGPAIWVFALPDRGAM